MRGDLVRLAGILVLVLSVALSPGCGTRGTGSGEGPRVRGTTRSLSAPGLAASYGFDEGSGTRAMDSSGRGLAGALSGQSYTAGRFGRALEFGGSYVTVEDASWLDLTTGMTLSAWVYPTRPMGRWPTIIMKEVPGQMSYTLYANSSTGQPSVYFLSGGEERGLHGGTALPQNTWTYLAATYDGATLRLYVNGSLVGTQAVSGSIDVSGRPLRIGGNSVWHDEFFYGRIDEVRIYSRALSAAEIAADMNTPVGPPPVDSAPPRVRITAPAAGSVVSGTITVSASAEDDVGVLGVRFLVDGAPLGTEDLDPPYSVPLDTTTVSTGAHTLHAVARDGAGNTTTSAPVVFTVERARDTTPPLLSALAAGSIMATSATISWTSSEPATSRVEYGTTAAYGQITPPDTTLRTQHAVQLGGLSPATTYHFRVRSADQAGNEAVSAGGTFTTAPSAWVPPPGLVAAYAFDEGSGTRAMDSSGRGLAGALSGQSYTAGRFGRALEFGGSYVTVEDASWLDLTTGMTLSAWVYPTRPMGRWPTIIMKEVPGQMSYTLYANSSTGQPSVYFLSGGEERGLHGGTALPQNTWTYLAATYDGATLRLYVNGSLVGTQAVSGSIDVSGRPLRIGGNSVWHDEFFYGRIDEVRIYSRALSAAEIAADMNTPVGPPPVDSAPPRVRITAPAAGSVVSGTITVSASAEDDVGVLGVRFLVDGAPLGTEDLDPPYSVPWNTRSVSNGTHTLTAVARDTAGKTQVSAAVIVNVENAPSPFPLRIAAGQRHLVDQAGRPFLIHGDTAWSLLVLLSKEDAEFYLEDRRQRGINTILVNLIEHNWPPSRTNVYGDHPFTQNLPGTSYADFTRPNEAYFAHADWVIKCAADKGIQVLLAPAYLGYGGGSEGWYQEMVANGPARLETYGRYIGNRYKGSPNIIYVQGGDYNPPDRSVVRAVASGIRAASAAHLHTASCAPGLSAMDCWAGESWLDVDATYVRPLQGQRVYEAGYAAYGRAGWKPVFLLEAHYEEEGGSSPVVIRQQAYEALLAGGMGQVFGNGSIWKFEPWWRGRLDTQGARDMTRVWELFSARRWERLVPDTQGTFLTAGVGSGAGRAIAARASDGSFGMVYMPSTRQVTINMGLLGGPARARFYDPSSGTFSAISGSPFANSGSRTFVPPGSNAQGSGDWVLVLEVN